MMPGSMFQQLAGFGQPGFNPGGLVPQLLAMQGRLSSYAPMALSGAAAATPAGTSSTPPSTASALAGLPNLMKQIGALGNAAGLDPTAGPLGNGNNGPGWGGIGGGLSNLLNGYGYGGVPGASVLNNLSMLANANVGSGAAGL